MKRFHASVGARTLARRNGVFVPPTLTGKITTLLSSGLNYPIDVAVIPSSKTIVIADTGNGVIKLLTYPGLSVSTLAGTAGSNTFADGTGLDARFNQPSGVAVLPDGNIVVADTNNHRIRIVTQAGVVTTLAGDGTTTSVNGTGTAASFNSPRAIAVLPDGNIVVTGGDHSVRRITYPGGVVTTFAGINGNNNFADGTGSTAAFNNPYGLTVLPNGKIAVADTSNERIRLITYPGAVVTTLAGNATPGSSDGTGSAASFYLPAGITGALDGNIIVSDLLNHTIRSITPLGVVTTIAGVAGVGGSDDGTGAAAQLYRPYGSATMPSGEIVFADYFNLRIRMLT